MHNHGDRCYTCRAHKAQKRAEFWRDVTDFAGMALAILVLLGLTALMGGV